MSPDSESRKSHESQASTAASVGEIARERVAGMQADWFIAEVKRCREIGMPLGCCDDWPECSHVLEWLDEREVEHDAAVAQLDAEEFEGGYPWPNL